MQSCQLYFFNISPKKGTHSSPFIFLYYTASQRLNAYCFSRHNQIVLVLISI